MDYGYQALGAVVVTVVNWIGNMTEVIEVARRYRPAFIQFQYATVVELERLTSSVGARLIVIDPVVAAFHESLDAHKDQHVRAVLARLSELAEGGYIERADRRVCGKSRASREVVRRPSVGRGADPDAVPLGGQSRGASEVARGNCRLKVLAFLAALVSTSVFSVLF